jgi:hypothetical protein
MLLTACARAALQQLQQQGSNAAAPLVVAALTQQQQQHLQQQQRATFAAKASSSSSSSSSSKAGAVNATSTSTAVAPTKKDWAAVKLDPSVVRAIPTTTLPGQAFVGDLRSTSGLGMGDGKTTHTSKWLTVRATPTGGAAAQHLDLFGLRVDENTHTTCRFRPPPPHSTHPPP